MTKKRVIKNVLSVNQLYWLEQLHQALLVGNYGNGTVRNYMMEIRLLFQYHHQKTVEDISQQDISQYIIFFKTVHGVGYAKCKSLALRQE